MPINIQITFLPILFRNFKCFTEELLVVLTGPGCQGPTPHTQLHCGHVAPVLRTRVRYPSIWAEPDRDQPPILRGYNCCGLGGCVHTSPATAHHMQTICHGEWSALTDQMNINAAWWTRVVQGHMELFMKRVLVSA